MGWQDTDELSVTLADKLVEYIEERNKNPANGILHHKENIDLLPANLDLSALELSLVNTMSRETVLKGYVNSIKTAYDYVVIDCMMTLSLTKTAHSNYMIIQTLNLRLSNRVSLLNRQKKVSITKVILPKMKFKKSTLI